MSITVKDSERIDPFATTKELQKIEIIRSVEYIDSTKAERDFTSHLGVNFTELAGVGVLPSSFLVTIKTVGGAREGINEFKQTVKQLDWVESVQSEDAIVEEIERTTKLMEQFSMWLGGVVGVVALIICFVLIKLSIGATFNCYDYQLRPILSSRCYRWAWVSGVVSGGVATGLLWFTIKTSDMVLPQLEFSYDTLPLISAVLIVGSTVMTLLSTALSIAVQK